MFLRNLLQASALLPFLHLATAAETACNNSPTLCSKAYNNITHLGAHDSPYVRDSTTSFSTSGNQYYNTTVQLDAGVRLLSAQVHSSNTSGTETLRLCHTSCSLLDVGTLESWLSEIKTWMDKNTNDVVTVLIVNSDDVSTAKLGSQFESAGLDEYAYTPASTTTTNSTTWPTLDNLISNGTRLMTFVASLSDTSTDYPYLMDEFTYMFENSYDNVNPSNYSCTPSRPTSLTTTAEAAESGLMFLMNHFLYAQSSFIESPNATYANTTNAQTGYGSLGVSIDECTTVYNKPPSFVMVDFFNMGPAIASVDEANGVSDATGRTSVSAEALTSGNSSTGGVGRSQGSLLAVVVAVVVAVAFG